jgi:hypothetical protein
MKRKRNADSGLSSRMGIECIPGPSKVRTRGEVKKAKQEDESDDDLDASLVPTSDPIEEELASPKGYFLLHDHTTQLTHASFRQ